MTKKPTLSKNALFEEGLEEINVEAQDEYGRFCEDEESEQTDEDDWLD